MQLLMTTSILCWSAISFQPDGTSSRARVDDPALRNELVRRTKADQDARTAVMTWNSKRGSKDALSVTSQNAEEKAKIDALLAAVKKTDSENTGWLKEVVETRGWPTRTLVGKAGANAAWLLIQHADAEPAFQRKCLDLMVKLPRDEVSQQEIAYLTDRVLLAEGKKQVYGTQFTREDGKLLPRPIEDASNVDKRRAEVGLSPLAEYAAEMAKAYGETAK